jgi:hypothetical protein
MKADALSQFDHERHLQTQRWTSSYKNQNAVYGHKRADLLYELAVLRHGFKSVIRCDGHLAAFKQWRQLSNVVTFVATSVDDYARLRVR